MAKDKKTPMPLPKNLWSGEVVFLLGGGPTLKQVDLSPIHHRRVIGVNNAYGDPVYRDRREKNLLRYEPRDWVDICWFGDANWFRSYGHKEWLKEFKGLVAHCCTGLYNWGGMFYYPRPQPAGIDTTDGQVAWNSNSGGAGINLTYHLGARRVVLLGFDMRLVDGQKNWHHDHPQVNNNPFPRHLRYFPRIARDARQIGLEIINCTPGSAIQVFPIMTLEEYLEKEKEEEWNRSKSCASGTE